jgi:hypothetical protein
VKNSNGKDEMLKSKKLKHEVWTLRERIRRT